MNKLILVFLALYTLIGAAPIDEEAKIAGYWKETTFTVKQAVHLSFDPNRCYSSPADFFACVNALQTMGALLKPSLTFLPTQGVIPAVVDETVPEKVMRIQRERTDILNFAQTEVKNKNPKTKINFHKLALQFLAKRPKDLPEGRLAVALYAGYSQAKDAHAHLDLLKQLQNSANTSSSSIIGIGALLNLSAGVPIVVSPPDQGTPADKANLQVGDMILEANGKNLKDVPLAQVVNFIKGDLDTWVHLKIYRAPNQFEVDIRRKKIDIENVEQRIAEDISINGKSIKTGYIQIRSFDNAQVCSDLQYDIMAMDPNVDGYVLDLRGNTGGFVESARCVGAYFAGIVPIAYTKDLKTGDMDTMVGNFLPLTDKKLVILINGKSASASEILSGSMQGLMRAFLVGQRSFGKASVQNGTPLKQDPKLINYGTTARYYVPYKISFDSDDLKKRTPQRIGVQPDFEVTSKPNTPEPVTLREADIFPGSLGGETTTWDLFRTEERTRIKACLDQRQLADAAYTRIGRDYQLLKAEEVLAAQIAPCN